MIGKEGKIIEISILIFYESGLNILWETLFYYRTPCVGVQSVAKSTKTIPRYDNCTSVRGVHTPSSSVESINSYTTINHPEWGSSIAPSTIVRPTVSE